MKKNLFLLGCMTALTMLSFQSCSSDDVVLLKKPLQPTSVSSCAKGEIALLRKIAEDNNMSADFASEDPSAWKYDHLQVVWDTTAVNKTYYVKELRSVEGEAKGITTLKLNDERNNFRSLERIEMKNAQLKSFSVANAPRLRTIIINGKGLNAENTELTSIDIHDLPQLDSLHIENLPKLSTTSADERFNIDAFYQYPKLAYVGIVNTGIKELSVDPTKPLKELKLSGNKQIKGLTLAEVALSDLTFNAETYPLLENLALRKLSVGKSKDLIISGLSSLTDVGIYHSNWLSKAEVSGCSNLKELTLNNCGLTEETCKLSNLPHLTTLNLDGNDFTSINLAHLETVKNLDLKNNKLTTTDNMVLSKAVEKLPLQGNENLQKVDLTPYKKLWLINVNGYKRGQDAADHQHPLALANVNLSGLTALVSVRLNNNSLPAIFDGKAKYPELETLEAEYNAITPIGMVNIANSLENRRRDVDFKLNYQTFAVEVKEEKTVDYSVVHNFFEKEGESLSFNVKGSDGSAASVDSYTYTNGVFTFKKAGSYKLSSNSFSDIFRGTYNYDSAVFTIQ